MNPMADVLNFREARPEEIHEAAVSNAGEKFMQTFVGAISQNKLGWHMGWVVRIKLEERDLIAVFDY